MIINYDLYNGGFSMMILMVMVMMVDGYCTDAAAQNVNQGCVIVKVMVSIAGVSGNSRLPY